MNNVKHSVRLTDNMPPLVVLHDVFAVEHLIANLTCVEFLSVFLLVLGEVTISGEKSRTYLALERFVICRKRTYKVLYRQQDTNIANVFLKILNDYNLPKFSTMCLKRKKNYTCPAVMKF